MKKPARKAKSPGSLANALLQAQGLAVFEHLGAGDFRRMGSLPEWFGRLEQAGRSVTTILHLGQMFPFLDNFLIDAEEVWGERSKRGVNSGTWIEKGRQGEEVALEATAIWLADKPILYLLNPQTPYLDQHRWLQTARDAKLQHERLLREIQKKEILLHCIIHDLSQPLTAMRGCFNCLEIVDMPENYKELVTIGVRQSHMQEEMIRGILEAFSGELAAREAGKVGADVARSAQEVAQDFAAAFHERGARITLAPDLDLAQGWKVAADESRLRRVWTNLVENALRHSPADSTVTLGVRSEGSSVLAFVDDEGPGLPGGDEPTRLFALFAKGKEEGGKAGLGLYFCRMTVERWGGKIGCESRPGRGSRFWFRLPRVATGETVAPVATIEPEHFGASAQITLMPGGPASGQGLEPKWRPLEVLLAEDVEANRQLISLMVEQRGHRVTAVANGREAFTTLQKQAFDVLMTDDEMPEMDGSDLVRAVRNQEQGSSRRLRIIGLSGSWDSGGRDRMATVGVDGFLTKPFRPNALHNLLESSFFSAQARTAVPLLAPQETADLVLSRFKNNKPFVRSLVKVFLRDADRRMNAIRSALTGGEKKAVARTVHGLAGSADMLGANRFAGMARLLQTQTDREQFVAAKSTFNELDRELSILREQLIDFVGLRPGRRKRQRARPAD